MRALWGCCLLLAPALLACPEPASPPEQHWIALPGHGRLVVDIEMWDTWERLHRSVFRFEPLGGGPVEEVVVRHRGRALPRVVDGAAEPQLRFAQQSIEPLVILAGERIVLRLPQLRSGSESFVVRAGPGDWRRYDFDDRGLADLPLWQADLLPYDAEHGGFTELARVDVSRLELTLYRHGGYVVRELTLRLAPDGRSIELTRVGRAPNEVRNRGRFEPSWASEALLARARTLFAEAGSGRPLADARIVELFDCPDPGPADRLRVLFLVDGPPAGRNELWRFERVADAWQAVEVELRDASSAAILERSHASYDAVRDCMKVY